MVLTATTVTLYIGNIILSHYIKEEIWVKRIWKNLFPPKSFKVELMNSIDETIREFETSHPYEKDGIKFPFYYSKILDDILVKHILFNNYQYNSEYISNELQNNPNIIIPTNKEIENFFQLFVSKIEANKELKKLFIAENYQSRIFVLAEKIDSIIEILKKAELTPEIVVNKTREQVEFQIRKQITSGKYIPDTFVEIDELKDHLRYFIAPYLFIDRIIGEIKKFNFDYLRKKLILKNKNINFDFNIDLISNSSFNVSNDELNKNVSLLNDYLHGKYDELESNRINASSSFTRKIQNKIDDLHFIQSKIIIIKGNAGQGKTNFLCDLAENVLLKRNIPSLFLTGYELDANDLYTSISKRLFPGSDYTFSDIFSRIDSYCEINKTFFILMIDGLNENTNPPKLSQNIELFINEILQHKHVKVVLTCRTEYFKNNFQNILDSDFKESLIQIDSINSHLDDNHKRCLYESYCSYYNLKINHISDDIYKELVTNFLLLRIFSEANKGQNIATLTHIYKEEVFQKYYSLKSFEINNRLKDTLTTPIIGEFDIKNLFSAIIEYMIEHKAFENIPIDSLLKTDNRNRDIYIRFLDENILLRKDIEEQNGIFGNKEFVNFTFDEFRDFLITDYLLNNLYENSKDKFYLFIEENINNKSRIKEGCMSFIFSMERLKGNFELSSFIRKQDWYGEVFPYYIFDIKDEYVTTDDKLELKSKFLNDRDISEHITFSLAYQRWNAEDFPNLNIQLLFEIFETLTDDEFKNNVYKIYPEKRYSHYDRFEKDQLEKLIERLEDILGNEDFSISPSRHNIFQYILYFLPIKHEINYLYFSYWKKYNNQLHFEQILNCQSEKLKESVNNFIARYEIQL